MEIRKGPGNKAQYTTQQQARTRLGELAGLKLGVKVGSKQNPKTTWTENLENLESGSSLEVPGYTIYFLFQFRYRIDTSNHKTWARKS